MGRGSVVVSRVRSSGHTGHTNGARSHIQMLVSRCFSFDEGLAALKNSDLFFLRFRALKLLDGHWHDQKTGVPVDAFLGGDAEVRTTSRLISAGRAPWQIM
jgi:hypothetical protein